MVDPGTARSVGTAVKAWWHLVVDEPAAFLVVILLAIALALGVWRFIDYFYVPRVDFQAQVNDLDKRLFKKLDLISCQVRWNHYSTQMQTYRVQDRSLTSLVNAQKRYLEAMGTHATERDRQVLDSLRAQHSYVTREEANLPSPGCSYPF